MGKDEWDEKRWDGKIWEKMNGMERDGVGKYGIEWYEKRWDGKRWDRMG